MPRPFFKYEGTGLCAPDLARTSRVELNFLPITFSIVFCLACRRVKDLDFPASRPLGEGGEFVPIGDVTLKEENPAIVIGVPKYRGIGIGKKVMRAIIARARELGIKRFYNTAIYDYNTASRRLSESVGFRCVGKRGNVMIYEMDLNPDAGT